MGSAGSLETPPRNYSLPALFSSTARERHVAGAHQFGDRHLYASVITVEMHHEYPSRDGGEAAPDAEKIDAPEITISMHLS
jgi:hypothetical protein